MKFRKKPVVINAWIIDDDMLHGKKWPNDNVNKKCIAHGDCITIDTLEGNMRGIFGEWLIQGVANEVYVCKPDIFEKTYEPVTNKE